MTARQLEDIHEAIVVVEVPAQGQTELVWSKYSNAHRVSSLHLLRTAITEYVVHYHTEPNRQGLGNELLTPLPASANDAGPIVSRERLGGILNYYCRAA